MTPVSSRRADQAAGGLHHAGHARHHEGVLEAALEALLVIVLEELLLERQRRQAGADHRHRLEHLAGVVDPLGEDAARHRHQQHVAEDGASAAPGGWPRARGRCPPGAAPAPACCAGAAARSPRRGTRSSGTGPGSCRAPRRRRRPGARRCARSWTAARLKVVATVGSMTTRRFSAGNGLGISTNAVRPASKPSRPV